MKTNAGEEENLIFSVDNLLKRPSFNNKLQGRQTFTGKKKLIETVSEEAQTLALIDTL